MRGMEARFADVRDHVAGELLALLAGALLVLLALFWLADQSIRLPLLRLRDAMRDIAQSLQLQREAPVQVAATKWPTPHARLISCWSPCAPP